MGLGNFGGAFAGGATVQIVISAIDKFSSVFDKASRKLGLLGKIGGFAVGGFATAGAAITAVGSAGLKSASDFEQTRIAFETMLGSAEKAGKTLSELSKFAEKTPFELPQVEQASKRLLAYGVSAEELIPTLKTVGDISAGVGTDKLGNLITALGQVKAKTVLSGEELRQFTETGVPLIKELAEVTGYSEKEITDKTKDLGISFEQVQTALKNMTSEGGKFFNLMEKQSQTAAGTISNLKDVVSRILREFVGITSEGEIVEGSLFDRFRERLKFLLDFIEENKDEILNFFNKMNEILAPILETVFELGKKAFKFISDWFNNNKSDLLAFWEEFKEVIGPVIDSLKNLAKNVLTKVFEIFKKLWNEVILPNKETIINMFKKLGNLLSKIMDIVIAVFDWFNNNKSDLLDFWEGFKEAMEPVIDSLKNLAKNVLTKIFEIFKKIWNDVILPNKETIISAFKKIGSSLSKIMDIASIVFDIFAKIVNLLIDSGALDLIIILFASIFKVIDDVLGVIKDVYEYIKKVIDAFTESDIGKTIGRGIEKTFDWTGSFVKNVFDVDDFILSKGKLIRTDPKDTIFGTKNPGGMGGVSVSVTGNNIYGTDPDEIAEAISIKLRNMISV